MDSEWFNVETAGGRILNVNPLPNREAAVTWARDEVPSTAEALLVVKYTRREIRAFERKVTIEETDVSAGA